MLGYFKKMAIINGAVGPLKQARLQRNERGFNYVVVTYSVLSKRAISSNKSISDKLLK